MARRFRALLLAFALLAPVAEATFVATSTPSTAPGIVESPSRKPRSSTWS